MRAGLRVQVAESDAAWLLAAGLERADRPEHFDGARIRAHRGRGHSILIERPGASLYAKTLRHGGLLAGLLGERFLGPSRLDSVIRITRSLAERGCPVPELVFARDHAAGLGMRRLELASRFLEGAEDLDAALVRGLPSGRLRKVAAALGRALSRMHETGVFHADLNLRNLLVDAEDAVWIIDIEGSTMAPRPLSERERVANLARLLRSLSKRGHWPAKTRSGLQRSDLLRVLRAYRNETSVRSLWRAVQARDRRWGRWHRLWWKLRGS